MPVSFAIGANAGNLGISNAATLGDMLVHKIIRREEFELMQGTTVQHVKDGKPLTALGAKLLGVPWPQ